MNNRKYKYDHLVKQNDIEVKTYIYDDYMETSISSLLEKSKQIAIKEGAMSLEGNSYSVYIKSIDNIIRVNRKGLFHSKNGNFSNAKRNAIVYAGPILSSAICLNEAKSNSTTIKILFNAVNFNNEIYIVRMTLYDNRLQDLEANRLKSIGIQKRNQPNKSTMGLLLIPSTISVKQLLENINSLGNEYQSSLPVNVLKIINGEEYERDIKKTDIQGLKY